MRPSIAALFFATLSLSACGEQAAPTVPAAPAPALTGSGWIADPVVPGKADGKVKVLAFFKPG